MFITAMAANPLSVNLAAAAIGHTISWTQWAIAASVPGLVLLIVVRAGSGMVFGLRQQEGRV